MAVGSKGSYGTVQPTTGIIDTSTMIGDAFDDLKETKRKEFEDKKKVEEERISILDSLASPDVAGTGQTTFDEIDYSIVNQMRDKKYEVNKKIQSGEVSISEGRALSANYNKKLEEYTQLRKTLTPTVTDFLEKYKNGEISTGLGEDWMGENGFVTSIIQGDVNNPSIDEKGNPVFQTSKGKKRLYLKNSVNAMANAPLAYDIESVSSGIAEEFVTEITKTAGLGLQGERNYYKDLETEGLNDTQRNLIREKAKTAAYDPKYQNDLWYKLKGEVKYSLTENEEDELSTLLQERMVDEVEARSNKKANEELDRTSISRDTKARREEEKERANIGQVQPIKINDYKDASTNIGDDESGASGSSLEMSQLGTVQEIPILTNNPTFESIQGESKGGTRTFNNFTVEAVAKADNGLYLARGYQLTEEGRTVSSQRNSRVEKIKHILSDEDLGRLEEAVESGDDSRILEVTGQIGAVQGVYDKDQTISKKDAYETVRTPEKRKHTSFIIPRTEVPRILRQTGVSTEDFNRVDSNNNEKPTFD